MCFSTSKRDTDSVFTPQKVSKRMHLCLNSDKGTSNENKCNCQPSSKNQCNMREHAYELLETLEQIEYHINYLEADRVRDTEELEDTCMTHFQEIEELGIKHDKELQRYHERINALEDEMRHQQEMLNVLNNNVEQLQEENRSSKDGY
ncbi:hypothetical protein DFJ58DRAFT_723371 [Suillus subalutaceus]|uniref:uncharacterized protein n=1 Tax=Suillus subalutaceus TaxID=48586 RepID=UPI001B85D311|nr:uncharacterized protein DFJ58DRAFT_723371 [Suillus subalutaceus]KAG1868958.1 hypothetical protein DFJ58DRAFT_723371 [Suillus subalutaceus]